MKDLRKAPRRFSGATIVLFRVLRWLGSRLWPGKAAYRAWLWRGALDLVRVEVPVAGLPADLEGLTLVQLSDLHAGPFLDEASLEPVLDLVAAVEPDLLVVTGDFVTRSADEMRLLGGFFERLRAPLGKFAVFGNHDYRQRREGEIARELYRQGVVVLRNASVLVRRGSGRLRFVGLEDIEEGKLADLDQALADARDDDDVTILLCHNPDVVDRLPPGRFDLVLAGHGHGGQVRLPLVSTLARRWLPRHDAGTHPLPGGRAPARDARATGGLLHVSRGLGVLIVPLRWGARPEVTWLELRRAAMG